MDRSPLEPLRMVPSRGLCARCGHDENAHPAGGGCDGLGCGCYCERFEANPVGLLQLLNWQFEREACADGVVVNARTPIGKLSLVKDRNSVVLGEVFELTVDHAPRHDLGPMKLRLRDGESRGAPAPVRPRFKARKRKSR